MTTAKRRLRVLVTGGAGYIGSHIVHQLVDAGHAPVVLDNLFSGHRRAIGDAPLIEGDTGDRALLDRLLGEQRFDALVHCAAHIWVGESVREPARYYANNAAKAFTLFDACARHGVQRVVFSSTAAVYGEPELELLGEDLPLRPINPYGASKAMAEQALRDIAAASGMSYAILRYFNVAGADARLRTGESTPDNSHLVKLACETALGLRPGMRINGTDYPTPDGTCVRDYVHVEDLAQAHLLALEHLCDGGAPLVCNCGYGRGYSVREVLDAVRRITGVAFPIETGPRRPGDPARLVADAGRITRLLDWRPHHDDLELIIASAWRWEQQLRHQRATAGAL
ncbi:UDP-glucose 4-epimerase GalE [Geminicoccaceae bacterium 1502E]|nr:UDP-glucose 4-epimerase GalE [Geminicoccaceae bacterium 1502E]